jgi:hypothetical protein
MTFSRAISKRDSPACLGNVVTSGRDRTRIVRSIQFVDATDAYLPPDYSLPDDSTVNLRKYSTSRVMGCGL